MPQERHAQIELSPELVHAYTDTFISRLDCYPRQNLDGSYFAIPSPLHQSIIEGHLKGHMTIGAYALNTENTAKWLCLDADDEPRWLGLLSLAQALQDKHIPLYIEPSRRGGHLWFFFEGMSGTDTRRFGKQLLKQHNLTDIEVYPKQDKLRTGQGSLVRLPLGVHQVSKHRYHFITIEGKPLAPTIREQIALLVHPTRVPQAFIHDILKAAPEAKPVFPTKPFKLKKHRSFGDTPSERIKNRISVYDFVGQYVDLDANGRGLCPFHPDHRDSLGVNQEGNFWHCFAGCGGGSIIDFWLRWQQLNGQSPDFKKALIELIQLLNL